MSDSPKIEMLKFNVCGDDRGSLVAIEDGLNIPFKIKRVYYLYDTKAGVSRGFHAHKELKQVAFAVKGSCNMILDNGKKRVTVKLDTAEQGLLIEGLIWREMTGFSSDCVLLVLASEHYDEADYIRNYDTFLELVNNDPSLS
jgi:dTDP-4-dehydrorhamnose 3,5-epimerase-like enzyme